MKYQLLFLSFILLIGCVSEQKPLEIGKEIIVSDELKIIPVTENVFVHLSYIQLESGPFPCNGMIYKNKKSAYVFDTPVENEVSKLLIEWLENDQKLDIEGVVINHFHRDCLGGLQAFHDKNIPSYANQQTQELAKLDSVTIPQNAFEHSQTILLGQQKIVNTYFGEAHTKDNIVSWLPTEKVLFGGCMVKSVGAGKGYLGAANLEEWSNTVQTIKETYNDLAFVIPGHGDYGDVSLLDYTIEMFSAIEE